MNWITLFILIAQAHALADVRIASSEKGAEVFLRDENDKVLNKLGTTPLQVKKEELELGRILVVEKSGFAPVYIPLMGDLKRDTQILVKLKRLEEIAMPDFNKRGTEIAEEIVDGVLTVQNLIEQKKYREAITLSENLRFTYPKSLAVRLVYSNALLMSGARDRALAQYNTILSDLPENRKLMRESIENLKRRLVPERSPAQTKEKAGGTR